MQLPHVVAIVSGAARGIGAAEAQALVHAGACVVLGHSSALQRTNRRKAPGLCHMVGRSGLRRPAG